MICVLFFEYVFVFFCCFLCVFVCVCFLLQLGGKNKYDMNMLSMGGMCGVLDEGVQGGRSRGPPTTFRLRRAGAQRRYPTESHLS